MRFSQDFIDKVRESNNIVEIIGQHTELKGSGHRLMGRCPFPDHSDKSPSFSVTEDNQLYYCYGCKKGGNVFTFLETYNGLSFPEAVEFLARRSSIPLPEKEAPRPGQKARGVSHDQKDLFLKVNKIAAVFFHQQLKALPEDHPAKKYLVKRGLTDDIVEKFRLGVSTEDWQGLFHQLESRKVPITLAESLGLLKPKKNKNDGYNAGYFDTFRDRLMFPIFSPTSDVIGFGGRTLGDGLPKYLNSSDSVVFNKSRVLYGIHETGKFIRAQDSAIVVEGYMDAIALYSAGIKNVVAILGTAFTADHAKILKRYTLNVTMLLDGDEAGINGAERSLPLLLEGGLMPKGFVLPDKMDPDDYVKAEGAEKLKNEIDRAPELFNLLLSRRWMQDYHASASEKVRVIDEAAGALRGLQNRQLMDLYFMELSQRLDVTLAWVRSAIAENIRNRSAARGANPVHAKPAQEEVAVAVDETPVQEEVDPRISLEGAPKEESFVLSLLLHHEGLMRELNEAGTDEVLSLISHAGIRRVMTEALEKYRANPAVFPTLAAHFASRVDKTDAITSSLELIPSGSAEGTERKVMADYLASLRRRHFQSQGKALASQLRDQVSTEKLEEFMTIQRNRLSVNRETPE